MKGAALALPLFSKFILLSLKGGGGTVFGRKPYPESMTQQQNNEPKEEVQEQDLSEILQIRRDKLTKMCENEEDPFQITTFDVTDKAQDILDRFDGEYEGKQVSVAGRIMSWRDMGKAAFMDLRDASGKIQLYIKIDVLGEEEYKKLSSYLDIGDIVGVTGEAFRTRRGEISIKALTMTILSKSLLPLPEKYHGLKDTDARYRQRYLDLMMNPEVKDTFLKRSKIISAIREFLEQKEFIAVETPVLHTMAGGAAARPFVTHHNALDIDMYLRIALELHLKRLIVGGFDKVYEMDRVFRNEGMDTRHNPEFTMLELYQAYTDYEGMMNLTEELIREVTKKVLGTTEIQYGDISIDVGKPFARITMLEAVQKYANVDFREVKDIEQARKLADEHHIEYETRHKKGDFLNLFFEKYCEHELVQPTFLMEHPVDISPLAKKKASDPEYTERFELFIVGREFANAFSELNDPIDQRERFEAQAALKAAGDDEACDVDEDFLTALSYAMPPTGGMGMGIDRLVMLLTGAQSIRDVLLFPTMKTIEK